MAASYSILVADPPPIHWIRNRKRGRHGKKRWIVYHPKEIRTVQLGTRDSKSPLSLFRGFEQSILRTIASFAGCVPVLPCTCCGDTPVRFCCQQCKPMLVVDPQGLSNGHSECGLPVKAFVNNCFFSYFTPMEHYTASDKVFDQASNARMAASDVYFCMLPGCYDTVARTGVLAITEDGLYSTILQKSWVEISEKFEVSVKCDTDQESPSGKKYVLNLKSEKSEPFSSDSSSNLLLTGVYMNTVIYKFAIYSLDIVRKISYFIERCSNEKVQCI